MPNPIIRIHNSQTDEVIDREMTAAELKEYNAEMAKIAAEKEIIAQNTINKKALLERLGINEEEAKLLLS